MTPSSVPKFRRAITRVLLRTKTPQWLWVGVNLVCLCNLWVLLILPREVVLTLIILTDFGFLAVRLP